MNFGNETMKADGLNSKEIYEKLCAKISDALDYLAASERARMLNVQLMEILRDRIVKSGVESSEEKPLTEQQVAELKKLNGLFGMVKTLLTVIAKMKILVPSISPSFRPKEKVFNVKATVAFSCDGKTHMVKSDLLSTMMAADTGVHYYVNRKKYDSEALLWYDYLVSDSLWMKKPSSRDVDTRSPPGKFSFEDFGKSETEFAADIGVSIHRQLSGISFDSLLRDVEIVMDGIQWPPAQTIEKAPKEDRPSLQYYMSESRRLDRFVRMQ